MRHLIALLLITGLTAGLAAQDVALSLDACAVDPSMRRRQTSVNRVVNCNPLFAYIVINWE